MLPLAMPGILTGTIIGLAQALGETAPLLMIGMVAFIVDRSARVDHRRRDHPARADLSLWFGQPRACLRQRTTHPPRSSFCSIVLVIVMNLLAVLLRRKRLERRW